MITTPTGMLILSRKAGQRINIGDDLTIDVTGIFLDQAKIETTLHDDAGRPRMKFAVILWREQFIDLTGEISVKLFRIEKDQVQLGIAAPRGVGVYRNEIYEERRANQFRAALARAITQ